MRTANECGRAVVALAVIVSAAALVGGCEAEHPVIVNVPAAQARLLVTFPDRAEKAPGDFDLDLTLRVHGEGEEHTELQRTIEVRGWVAQGVLEVPPNVSVMLSARAVMDGQPYVGNGFVPPLAPGTSTTVAMEMFPER